MKGIKNGIGGQWLRGYVSGSGMFKEGLRPLAMRAILYDRADDRRASGRRSLSGSWVSAATDILGGGSGQHWFFREY